MALQWQYEVHSWHCWGLRPAIFREDKRHSRQCKPQSEVYFQLAGVQVSTRHSGFQQGPRMQSSSRFYTLLSINLSHMGISMAPGVTYFWHRPHSGGGVRLLKDYLLGTEKTPDVYLSGTWETPDILTYWLTYRLSRSTRKQFLFPETIPPPFAPVSRARDYPRVMLVMAIFRLSGLQVKGTLTFPPLVVHNEESCSSRWRA
jgi:hypothetical protein